MTPVPLNLTPMRAIAEMRAAVDAFAARYAAARVAAGADKRTLLDAFSRFQKAVHDCRLIARADWALHRTIVDLADVPGLTEVWEAAAGQMGKFQEDTIRTCWPDLNVLFEAHRPIVDAICAGDQALAEDAARFHLDAIWYRLAESTADASLPDDPLARARTYLAFHLHESVRLSFLAEYVAKVSPGHLARLFRQQHNASFTGYLRELRMQKAADLVRRTQLPVQRIAARIGYDDPSRFATHFRRRFGVTPREFRRRFGGPKSV